jgi:hypothetical protein
MRHLVVLVLLSSLAHADDDEELVSRENWLELMSTVMPERACRQDGAGRGCYQASEAGCLAVEQAVLTTCVAKARDGIPEFLDVPQGMSTGASLRLCSADRYELIFGDTRDREHCPLEDAAAKQVMKRDEWVAALKTDLPARICVEETDVGRCVVKVGKCIARVARKAPHKLHGVQRSDWLGRVVACTTKH